MGNSGLGGWGWGWPGTLADKASSYFVDATSGDDSASGRCPDEAWKTIGKVNAATFLPGDFVHFKCGETWTGTALEVTWSGSAGNPITFTSYGSGNNPIIDGNDTANCITATSKNYIAFSNIDCTQGLDFGMAFTTCTNVAVADCDCHDCGNDNLIFIDSSHDCTVTGGSFYNGYSRVADGRQVSGLEIADGCYNITVTDVEAYDQADSGVGITVHSHSGETMPYNITITGSYFHENAGSGIRIVKGDGTADTDRAIVVSDNRSHANTLDGIQATHSGAEPVNGLTVSDNLFYLNLRWGISLRGDDFDAYRNAITSNNAGAQTCVALDGINTGTFYNNTLYATYTTNYGMMVIAQSRTANLAVKNNIVAASGANPYMCQVASGTGTTGLAINYNLYSYTSTSSRWTWGGSNVSWTDWLSTSSQDANSPTRADPSFTNAGSDVFTLQAGSPAIDVGVDVGLDYNGDAPDCGAYETS